MQKPARRKRKPKPKHIFCIEGNWDMDLNEKASVRPVLELLEINADVKYIYRDCSTVEELYFLLERWQQKRYSDHKILYLAFHGKPGEILIDHKHTVSLEDLGDALATMRDGSEFSSKVLCKP